MNALTELMIAGIPLSELNVAEEVVEIGTLLA
jgi:hypothetical protein